MSEPTTWLVLQQVRAAILLIQISRGYLTDLGLGVVVMDADQLPEDDVAHTVIVATEIEPSDDGTAASTMKSDMDIVIEFSMPFDGDAQLMCHRARADIVRALLALRKRLRELPLRISGLVVTGSRIAQPEEGAATVIAQVTARAGLVESISPASP